VWAYPWHQIPNPFAFAHDGDTPDDLARYLVRDPQTSAAVYGRINNRGVAQDVSAELCCWRTGGAARFVGCR
jgi:hypothetical protein